MKTYLFSLFFLLLLLNIRPAQAQTEKGHIMVGMQVANIEGVYQKGSNSFHLDFSPSAAYFVDNNIAIGGMINLGIKTQNKLTSFIYGIGPWARYYFPVPEEIKFSPHAAFFVDGFAGFQGVTHEKGANTNGIGIKVGPGVSYFISSNVSLDASLSYNLVLGFGNVSTVNKIGLNIGFQIFLPGLDLKERYQKQGF